MGKKKRRVFTPDFKADAVRLCRTGDRSIGQVARDLGLTETALRTWVKQAEQAEPQGLAGSVGADPGLSSAERSELQELRKRVKRLEMEKDILKKAAAFFAKESA